MANAKQSLRRLIGWTLGLGLVASSSIATSCASSSGDATSEPPNAEEVAQTHEGASLCNCPADCLVHTCSGTLCLKGTGTAPDGTACGDGRLTVGKCLSGVCCTGCLAIKGTAVACATGTTNSYCGSNGDTCKPCTSGGDCQAPDCSTGSCLQKQAADQTGCSTGHCASGVCCGGCIDANNLCQLGTTTAICGSAGSACASCDDGDPCTTDACDATAGCTHTFNANGVCSDGDACTNGEHCMQDAAGGISCGGGTAAKCDDNVDCTQDSCDPTQGCVHAPLNSGTCTDSGTCGGNATCQQGKCVGMGTPCNDMNPCTQNTCLNGQCTFPMEMPGTACVFDACHTGSTCSANGQCQMGTAINCDDANPCTADSCDPANGCVHQPNNAGTCSDGNACTTADKCVNGTCTGTGIVCTALDECHKAGTCDMTAGGCSDPRQNDGFPCTGGTCQGGRCVLGDGGVVGSGGSAGTGGEAGDTASGGSSASGGSTQTPPAHVFTRNPGGCACTVPVESTSRHGEYLLALALGIGLARRRRDSSTRGSVAAARQRG